MNDKVYANYRSAEVKKSLNKVLFIPIGSIEQHGPHLPLTVDVIIAKAISMELVSRFDGVIAPEIVYATRSLLHCGGGDSFPGTIYIKAQVFIEYLTQIISAFVFQGFKKIVLINGHFENESYIFEALEICRNNNLLENVSVLALSWWSIVENEFIKENFSGKFFGWHAEHASICETSLMMHLKPDLVLQKRVDNDNIPREGIYIYPLDPCKATNQGVLAFTTQSSEQLGKKLFDHICDKLQVLIEQRNE